MRPVPDTEPFEEAVDKMQMLGSREEVTTSLVRICHNVSFPDPAKPNHGLLQGNPKTSGEDYYIEFEVEERNDLVESISISSRCWFGDDVIGIIHRICQETDWRVFDAVSGVFINIQTGEKEEGWHVPQSIASEDINWGDPVIAANIAAFRKKMGLES